MNRYVFSFFWVLIFSVAAIATEVDQWQGSKWEKWAISQPHWVEPFEPFNVIGNIHYVGSKGIASYLFTSAQGHVLLDGGLPQNAALIASNIEKLGFKLSDIKWLINSHAHFDHSGGLAELKALTGASLLASAADKEWLENGRYPGSDNEDYLSIPVEVDKVIEDQAILGLGDIYLQAELTPGHSPGCTSWRTSVKQADKTYSVVLFCSGTVAGNRLVNPPQHPGIVEDYRSTFVKAAGWEVDVYLANHPEAFGFEKKRAAQKDGNRLAFVDAGEFPQAVKRMSLMFEKRLAKELAELKGN